ncbi:MAG: transglutaminase family protein [Bacteroidota bacterium]
MPSRKDIPFLITLLEDQSYAVQAEVRQALKSFGPRLEKEVAPFRYVVEPENWLALEEILEEIREVEFHSGWLSWIELGNSKSSLEKAMINLSFLEFGAESYSIEQELDRLAEDFLDSNSKNSAEGLCNFLFNAKGFRLPDEKENSHLHDSLLFSLRQRKGSDLSLTSIGILVGWRVGLDLYPIEIRNNFLLISFEEQRMKMFNPSIKGEMVERASALYIEEAFRRNCLMPSEMRSQVHEMVAHVLRNHIDYFANKGRKQEAREYMERFDQLMDALKDRGLVE